jgi:Reverse transcriptase (RNA-dependent DNA polymerase)
VYQKQFKFPEAHQNFIEQSLEEWLKLGVIKLLNSLCKSPIFCVPEKQGHGLQVVQDFHELNIHSLTDKYTMKQITGCIGDIGWANTTIFSTLNLTSGFWQMQLDDKSQPLTAFTILNQGEYQWITSPMGFLGCPPSLKCLMEGVLHNISNVIVYIDDLLIYTKTHDKHLQVLDNVLEHFQMHNLKINKVHFAKMTDFMEQKFGTAVSICEHLIHTAYNHRLSPIALHHDALLEIVRYVNEVADKSKMLSFVH